MNNGKIAGIRNVKFYDLNGNIVAELDKITDISILFNAAVNELPSAEITILCNNVNLISRTKDNVAISNEDKNMRKPEDYFKEVYKEWF